MRVSLLFTVAFAALLSLQQASAQCANSRAQCPATQASVPTAWYSLDFNLDPRLNPDITIANAGYDWLETAPADSCAQFHTGMINLVSSTNNSDSDGPHVNLMTTSGKYSVGTAIPGIIGGAGSGSYAQATRGWSFEVTVRASSEGDRNNWAKIVSLGTSSQKNGQGCNGEWLVGWQSNTDEVSMGTCTNRNEAGTTNFIVDAPDFTWMHIVSVIQNSPTGLATYSSYYNGELIERRSTDGRDITNPRANVQQLVQTLRDRSYLGRSSWPDAYFNGTIDNFAIYDIALTPSMVQGLYGEKMNGCTVVRAPYANTTVTSTATASFEASFTSDITTFTGGNPDFSWLASDPEDACPAASSHQGLLALAGDADWTPSISAGPYVDLSATSTGPNYIGQTLGVFGNVTAGQGSVTEGTAGFSIEVSFKAAFQNPASKIWALGNAATTQCVAGDIWAGWKASSYSLEIKYCDAQRVTRNLLDGTVPLRLRTWYHLVVAVSAQTNGFATWTVFLNGQIVAVVNSQYMPGAIPRVSTLLGRSLFFGSTDTYWSGVIDKFAVYPRALAASQVSTLATSSGITNCPTSNNELYVLPSNAVTFQATWTTDPRPAGANYNWLSVDVNDTAADQQIHRGMIVLGGLNVTRNPGQFVNLTASTGPNSMGQTIGQFGGQGTGNYNSGTLGWTFEQTFKILPTTTTTFDAVSKNITRNGMDWAKLFDFGDGNKGNGDLCENDVIMGFNAGDPWMKFQSCNPVNQEQNVGSVARRTMKVNTWYHAVETIQLTPTGGIGSLYLNGELIETAPIASFPLLASRQNARIGGSSWANDQFFNGAVELFSVYSQSVNQRQVNYMYALAFNQTLPFVPAVSSSSTGAAASSSTGAAASSSTGANPTAIVTSSAALASTGASAPTGTPASSSTGPDDGTNGAASVSMTIVSVLVVVISAMLTL